MRAEENGAEHAQCFWHTWRGCKLLIEHQSSPARSLDLEVRRFARRLARIHLEAPINRSHLSFLGLGNTLLSLATDS